MNKLLLAILIFAQINLHALEMWVTNGGNDTVSIFDTNNNSLIGTIPTAEGMFNGIEGLNFSKDGSICYIMNIGNNTISVMDVLSRKLITTITGTSNAYLGAINPSGSLFYLPNYTGDTIGVYSTQTNLPYGNPIPSVGGPFPIEITPDGSLAYVGNYNIGTISLISLNTVPPVVSTIDGPFSGINSLAISPNGKTVYSANFNTNSVTFFPTKTTTPIITSITSEIFTQPFFVVISLDGSFAYVLSIENGPARYLSIINTATKDLVRHITSMEGNFDNSISITINPNGLIAYVINYGDSISLIDMQSNTYVGSILDPTLNGSLYSAINNPTPYPPINAQGFQIKNEFLTQKEYINVLKWEAPKTGIAPSAYQIYSDVGLTNLIATVSANSNLSYTIHNQKKNKNYIYYIVSISSMGTKSNPETIIINKKKTIEM